MRPTLALLDRRRELADFLRTRRERLSPEALGLPRVGRRRTPGLRREEVAQLAGVSIDWYVRLEQGREVVPSAPVLEAIAGALRLTIPERRHLFLLARGEEPSLRSEGDETPNPGLLRLLESLDLQPALILGRRMDILAWNEGITRLIGDLSARPVGGRNIVELVFTDPEIRGCYPEWNEVARETLATLRAALARYPQEPAFLELVERLCSASPEFRALWAEHEVREKTHGSKLFRVNGFGDLRLDFHCFMAGDLCDQRLVLYTAAPGTREAELLGRIVAPRPELRASLRAAAPGKKSRRAAGATASRRAR